MSSSTSPPLPSLDTPCVKCGYPAFNLTWIPATDDPQIDRTTPAPYDEPREHLSAVCKQCGFVWPVAPLDATEGS